MSGQFDGQNDLVSSRNHPDSNDTEVQGAAPEVIVGAGFCPLRRGFLVQTRRAHALALLFLNLVVGADIDHRHPTLCRHLQYRRHFLQAFQHPRLRAGEVESDKTLHAEKRAVG